MLSVSAACPSGQLTISEVADLNAYTRTQDGLNCSDAGRRDQTSDDRRDPHPPRKGRERLAEYLK